jgi:RNA polymerase sigma-70 factor (ECF subfamily)
MNWVIFQAYIYPIRHKLYRFALKITGDRHDAEDIVQDVMEKVWKNSAESDHNMINWEAWCMTLTKNQSLDKTRSLSKRRTLPLAENEAFESTSPSLIREIEMQDLTTRVKQMMQVLPEKQRLVMHLRDVEELSYEEITQALGLSLDQVKVNLFRARKYIREKMVPEH